MRNNIRALGLRSDDHGIRMLSLTAVSNLESWQAFNNTLPMYYKQASPAD